jgi:large subunit ribosomal protein L29
MANKGNKVNYSNMAKEDLVKGIVQEKQRYYKMQFNHAVSPLANPIELRAIRRNIARMLTALASK